MKLLFVVNPISGGVNKEPFLKLARQVCQKYGVAYHIFKTTGVDDHTQLKIVLDHFKPDKVASVGGDGTTLFTSITLLGTSYPMGIIPLGSANGMATELFVNPNPIEALKDLIMSQIVRGLDLIQINEKHHCMHIGDVGINAQIVKGYEKDTHRGMVTYAKYFMNELMHLKPFPVTIKTNGMIYDEKVLMVAICNARKYGTGIPLNIKGNPMDGKLELVLVKKVDTKSLIKSGLSKFDDKFYDNQSTTVLSMESGKITFDKPRLLQLDGEIIGKEKELRLRILKGVVKLITNCDNKFFA